MTRSGKKGGRRWSLRRWVQIGFLVVVAAVAVNHTLGESGRSIPLVGEASLHAICPFGGVVSVYQYATTGTFVQKIHDSSFILMIAGLALALLVGPAFCGWACPMGSVQEWLGSLGRRLLGKRFNRLLPERVDRILRYLRYVVLALVIGATIGSARLVFADYDPYYALFNFWTGEVATGALLILGVVLVLSLVVERPFCKYACPYGALLGLFNLVRVFKFRRNPDTCVECGRCDSVCPMNIRVSTTSAVRDHQCISCMKCTSEEACPIPETMELRSNRFGGASS